ncbi:hypothetical protein NU08_2226 [Flavobacterium anhuiense]|uniref:Uncharacterized protein n=1 Tax=Flavobacterium anhuiense TaxID=459526 RepID=A0A444VYD8_9FLAO|nr:hypothetical protein NU08_2226 [Flavobacterium anhuiense]
MRIVCHFDEGEISASNSVPKNAKLWRATYGDFSFVELTKSSEKLFFRAFFIRI